MTKQGANQIWLAGLSFQTPTLGHAAVGASPSCGMTVGTTVEPKHQSWHTVGALYVLAEGEKEGREGQEKQSGCQKSYKHEFLAWSPRLT